MKKSLLFILFVIFTLHLQAQKDTTSVIANSRDKVLSSKSDINLSIYPVPVRENYFTINSDKEVSFVKITNIIGQDIYRAQYNHPETLNKIILDNPRRGMYLVTIVFSDGMRIVKKIMIEQSE
jgi:hypothetical protein